MNIIVGIILIETGAIALLIAIIVGISKRLARTTEKLKVARLQIASMKAIYNQLNIIKADTAKHVAQLNDVDACINYMNGGADNGKN